MQLLVEFESKVIAVTAKLDEKSVTQSVEKSIVELGVALIGTGAINGIEKFVEPLNAPIGARKLAPPDGVADER